MTASSDRSFEGVYFSDINGSNKIYGVVDPVPFPVVGNKNNVDIIHRTLPGLVSGVLTSGRAIHINMGGEYEDVIEFNFTASDDWGTKTDFITKMRAKRDSMEDFIMSLDDGVTKYKVSFTGENSFRFARDQGRITKTCFMRLIVLEQIVEVE